MQKDIRDVINEHLKKEDRDLPYLEKKTGLSYSHLYYIFVRKERVLTDENKAKINLALGTNF